MGLEAATLESSIDVNLALHAQVLDSRMWEAVPVEVEAAPDRQPRQHLQQQESQQFGARYDYISFSDNAAMVNKSIHACMWP